MIDYLLATDTERKLAASDAAQIPLHEGVEVPPDVRPIDRTIVMPVDYVEVARLLQEIQPSLQRWLDRAAR